MDDTFRRKLFGPPHLTNNPKRDGVGFLTARPQASLRASRCHRVHQCVRSVGQCPRLVHLDQRLGPGLHILSRDLYHNQRVRHHQCPVCGPKHLVMSFSKRFQITWISDTYEFTRTVELPSLYIDRRSPSDVPRTWCTTTGNMARPRESREKLWADQIPEG